MGADERLWPTDRPRDIKKRCDAIAGRIVHRRSACQRCGTRRGPYQAAHLVPRVVAAYRCRLDNIVLACLPCHRLIDSNPDEKAALAVGLHGEVWFWEAVAAVASPIRADAAFWQVTLEALETIEATAPRGT